MTTLICFGFGYCAEHFAAEFGNKFDRIIGTVRGAERAAILNAYDGERLRALIFDGRQLDAGAAAPRSATWSLCSSRRRRARTAIRS